MAVHITIAVGAILLVAMLWGVVALEEPEGVVLVLFLLLGLCVAAFGSWNWTDPYRHMAAHHVGMADPASPCRSADAWSRESGRTFTCRGWTVSFNRDTLDVVGRPQ